MTKFKAALVAGLAGGVAFFAHAMVQNSHAWPLLWAFVAGVLAIVLAARSEGRSFGPAVGVGALAGLIAGIVFLVATAIAIFGLGVPEEAARDLASRRSEAIAGMAVAAAVAIIPAAIGAALAYLATRRT